MWTIRLWRSFFPDYTRKKEKNNVCWIFKLKTKRYCLKMAKAGHERQHLFPQHFWAIENRVQKKQHSRNYFHKEFQVE